MLNKKNLIASLSTIMLLFFTSISSRAFADSDSIKILLQACSSQSGDCSSGHFILPNTALHFSIDGQHYTFQNQFSPALGDYSEIDSTFLGKTLNSVNFSYSLNSWQKKNDEITVTVPSRANFNVIACFSLHPVHISKENTVIEMYCTSLAG